MYQCSNRLACTAEKYIHKNRPISSFFGDSISYICSDEWINDCVLSPLKDTYLLYTTQGCSMLQNRLEQCPQFPVLRAEVSRVNSDAAVGHSNAVPAGPELGVLSPMLEVDVSGSWSIIFKSVFNLHVKKEKKKLQDSSHHNILKYQLYQRDPCRTWG